MVGYNPNLKLTETDIVFAGAASNAVARAVNQPFDVLKIRFQLQIEPISKGSLNSKYHGLLQAVQCIVKEEGYRALWKGHVPAQVLSIGYGIVQFATFEYLTKVGWYILPENYAHKLLPVTHTVCGGIAACVSTVAVQPVDVLRTRFIAQGEPKIYTSFYHAARSIYKTEGVRGFYKGLSPAVLGIAPQMGLSFGFYAFLQNMWNKVFKLPENHHPGTIESFLCGSGSGFFSKLLIYPLDLMKKRLQIQGFEEARKPFGKVSKYTGLRNCFVKLIKEEGILGLYKGLSPSLLKAVFVSGTIFCVYDQICYGLSLRHD